jgi:acetyl-CoA synthetase
MHAPRDVWWHDAVPRASHKHEAPALDAEHPLFILYTSGSTGQAQGRAAHDGRLPRVGTTLTASTVFDLKPEDVYWCTADIGWITGHSYVVYGPLSNGATVMLYEGAPNQPDPGRFWRSSSATASASSTPRPPPSAPSCAGATVARAHDLSSLRLLGTVGEPINPEAWMWYHRTIGGGAARSSTPGGRPRRARS